MNAEITTACPHCTKPVRVVLRGYLQQTDAILDPEDPLAKLSPPQREAIETARKVGILGKFEDCVRVVKESQVPKSIEHFYVTFMRTAVQKVVPREILNIFRQAYTANAPNAQLEFWASQGIGMVIADGAIQAFVPTEYTYGAEKSVLGGRKIRTSGNAETVREWINTRGTRFSVGQRLSLVEQRKKSMGG